MLADGGGVGKVPTALRDVSTRFQDGSTLADALGTHPELFVPQDLQVIRASEHIGDVAPAFEAVAQAIDARIAFRKTLLGKGAYPMLVLTASIFLGPLPELVVGSASAYAAQVFGNVLFMGLVLALVFVGLPWLLRRPDVGDPLRRFAWKAPWPGSVYRDTVRAMFSKVLARNMAAGLPIHPALESAAAVTADPVTIERIARASRAIRGGSELAEALGQQGVFADGDRMQLIAGERSGTLTDSLGALAATYGERSERGLSRILKVAGGILTAVVFIYVAFGIVGGLKKAVLGPMDEIEKALPYNTR